MHICDAAGGRASIFLGLDAFCCIVGSVLWSK